MLSAQGLRHAVTPFISVRTAFKRNRPGRPLPGCLGAGQSFQISRERFRRDYFNLVLECFPERLATGKWRERARISGLEHVETARKHGRPVVLAFCHFGPYFLLRNWLRAAGFPVATLVKGEARDRSRLKRWQDRVSPFADVASAFYQDELREMVEFIVAGNVLLVALDGEEGRQMDVALDEDWSFRFGTGAIRLAIHHRADLLPCTITDEGDWHFRIRLGPPLPAESLRTSEICSAAKYLLDAMLPEFRKHPGQCRRPLLKQFHARAFEAESPHEPLLDSTKFASG